MNRLAPVIVGFHERQRGALHPVLEFEGAGADRLFLVGVGAFWRHDHRVAPAHIVEEGTLRLLQRHLHRRRVDDLDGVDGGEKLFLRVLGIFGTGAVQRELDVRGIEIGAVVELHALV